MLQTVLRSAPRLGLRALSCTVGAASGVLQLPEHASARAAAETPGAPQAVACPSFAAQTCSLSTEAAAAASQPADTSKPDTDQDADAMFSGRAVSLEWERAVPTPYPEVEQSPMGRMALQLLGYYDKEAKLTRGATATFEAICEQVQNPYLLQPLNMDDTFFVRFQMRTLHIWLILQRLRQEGDDAKKFSQTLYDFFQDDVELGIRREGVKVRINKWLTELEEAFYGTCVSYDKAMEGKEDMVDALLRNVYGEDASKKKEAQLLEQYVQRQLKCLAMTDTQVIMDGQINFSMY